MVGSKALAIGTEPNHFGRIEPRSYQRWHFRSHLPPMWMRNDPTCGKSVAYLLHCQRCQWITHDRVSLRSRSFAASPVERRSEPDRRVAFADVPGIDAFAHSPRKRSTVGRVLLGRSGTLVDQSKARTRAILELGSLFRPRLGHIAGSAPRRTGDAACIGIESLHRVRRALHDGTQIFENYG